MTDIDDIDTKNLGRLLILVPRFETMCGPLIWMIHNRKEVGLIGSAKMNHFHKIGHEAVSYRIHTRYQHLLDSHWILLYEFNKYRFKTIIRCEVDTL